MVKMKWLGYINLYFLLMAVGIVFHYTSNYDQTKKNATIHVEKKLETPKLEDLEFIVGEERPGFDVAALVSSSDEKIKKGRELFSQRCTACHGQTGKGDGLPNARNFGKLEGWVNGNDINGMFKTLQFGTTGGMAAFTDIPIEDRFNLFHFIRTLAPGYPEITDANIQALKDDYQLDKPKRQKSQISIERAIELIKKEKLSEFRELDHRMRSMSRTRIKELDLFISITNHPPYTILALSRSDIWKESPEQLRNFLLQDRNAYRVNQYALEMPLEDWAAMHRYLKLNFL